MKALTFFVFVECCLASITVFAQTPKSIEADLLKSFKRIGYWDEKSHNDTTYEVRFEDSLSEANKVFGEKLKYYAERYPTTINQDFALLRKEYCKIYTSSDGLFRIYSWDTQEGGTMHSYENVFQYITGNKTLAVIDTPKDDGDICYTYTKILTVNSNKQRYYIANFLFIESSRYYNEGLQAFAIEDGKLDVNFKGIKTMSGLHNQINYEYDLSTVADMNKIPSIIFDQAHNSIKMPVVDTKSRFINGYITYKFTGQYFERVKN